ncbi:hypothetical protein TWF281_001734 [Arthrobotrys megalospora]
MKVTYILLIAAAIYTQGTTATCATIHKMLSMYGCGTPSGVAPQALKCPPVPNCPVPEVKIPPPQIVYKTEIETVTETATVTETETEPCMRRRALRTPLPMV